MNQLLEDRIGKIVEGVSWEEYTRTLHAIEASGGRLRVTYYRGRMEIMTVGPRHEGIKNGMARLLEIYSLYQGITLTAVGNVTCRRHDLIAGLEPDETYYVGDDPPNLDVDELDLTIVRPPDVAIEVELTSKMTPERRSIYFELGVPELWRHNGTQALPFKWETSGYTRTNRSTYFPDLDWAEYNDFVTRALSRQGFVVREYAELLRTRQTDGTSK